MCHSSVEGSGAWVVRNWWTCFIVVLGDMPGCAKYHVFCFYPYVEFVESDSLVFQIVNCSVDLETRKCLYMLESMEMEV